MHLPQHHQLRTVPSEHQPCGPQSYCSFHAVWLAQSSQPYAGKIISKLFFFYIAGYSYDFFLYYPRHLYYCY